ncbi:hypothetical protein F5Y04DRAFT_51911 [Hypomontagnella monticulosa]|nr:hypothetical protein F5Y04DRAFT_51911 [Hypomontagnella monticulosa]
MRASRDLPRHTLSPTSLARGSRTITLSSPSISFYLLHPLLLHRTRSLSRAFNISVGLYRPSSSIRYTGYWVMGVIGDKSVS